MRYVTPVRVPEYRKALGQTLAEWEINLPTHMFDKTHYRGIPIWKNPLDLWIFQEIIHETKPRFIIEIGSRFGGTTQFLADLLELQGGDGIVISIDIDRNGYRASHKRIRNIDGSSMDPAVLAQVKAFCTGPEGMVVHDGDHNHQAVLMDLKAYSPLVGKGQYFIVEDGIMDKFWPGRGPGSYCDGPLPAIDDFLQSNHDFVVDSSRERYVLTENPKGYLQRIR
jgi:cephalosporin hydroxylase